MLNHPLVVPIVRIAAAATSFGFTVGAARILGVEFFGVFNVLIAFVNVGVVFSLLGHETLATRIVAKNLATGDGTCEDGILTYTQNAAKNVWSASAGVICCISVLLWILPIGETMPFAMWMLLLIIAPIARARLSQGIIRGANLPSLSLLPDGLFRPGIALIGFTVLLLLGKNSLATILVLMLGSALVSLFIAKKLESHALRVPLSIGYSKPHRDKNSPLRTSPAIYISSILGVLSTHLAVIATGNLAEASQVGLFAAAERFAFAASLVGQAIYLAMASQFASLHAQGKPNELGLLVRRVTRGVSFVTILLCVAMALCSDILLGILGSEFTDAQPVLLLLLLAVALNVGAGPVGILLLMTNNENGHLIALSISLGVQLFLFPVVVPSHGIVGAAWVVLIATIAWNAVMLQFAHRKLSLNRILAWA